MNRFDELLASAVTDEAKLAPNWLADARTGVGAISEDSKPSAEDCGSTAEPLFAVSPPSPESHAQPRQGRSTA